MCVGHQSSPAKYWSSGLSFLMSFRAPLSSCRLKGVGSHLVTKSRGGTEHVSSSPSGNVTLSRSIPTMSFSSGVGMMYSVPELPTWIPSFIASDRLVEPQCTDDLSMGFTIRSNYKQEIPSVHQFIDVLYNLRS